MPAAVDLVSVVPCQLPLESSVSAMTYQAEHMCRGCILAKTRLTDYVPCYGSNQSNQLNGPTGRINYGSSRVRDILERHAVTSGRCTPNTHTPNILAHLTYWP